MNSSEQSIPENGKENSTSVISGALASGGIIGAGLAILALRLPQAWHAVAIALVPTCSSAVSLWVRALTIAIRKRHNKKLWEKDQEEVVLFVDGAVAAARSALRSLQDPTAKNVLESNIARLELMKALALTAVPNERPWLLRNVPPARIGDTQFGIGSSTV
jgi:hypothetical protein